MESERIVGAFLKPETYDEKVSGKIEVLQTHISWVFLTGSYAYKIKKPVDFGFLDFTTLEKRKKYCELELTLNRRLCPEMYLGVIPVAEDKGILKMGGRGRIIEYALKMRQMPREKLMNRLLERGEIGKDVIDRIAKVIADFHSGAETSAAISKSGNPESVKFNWDENFEQTTGFVGKVLARKDFDFVKKTVIDFLEKNKNLFEKRVRGGRIRRIHGDLHSGNIFVVGGKPCIFDCIEFSDRFSCLDTAADVAFLSMDLDFKGRRDLSELLVKKYIVYSGDEEIARILNFYKCYYAWVRGKVTSFRLNEKLGKAEKLAVAESASGYFRLAAGYAGKL